jgi:hypothetical protein
MLRNAITNTPNTRNTLFDFPSAGGTPGPLGTAGAPPINTQNLGNGSGQPVITGEPLAGQQFNGADLTSGPRVDPGG